MPMTCKQLLCWHFIYPQVKGSSMPLFGNTVDEDMRLIADLTINRLQSACKPTPSPSIRSVHLETDVNFIAVFLTHKCWAQTRIQLTSSIEVHFNSRSNKFVELKLSNFVFSMLIYVRSHRMLIYVRSHRISSCSKHLTRDPNPRQRAEVARPWPCAAAKLKIVPVDDKSETFSSQSRAA
jgi:hypothetical protein